MDKYDDKQENRIYAMTFWTCIGLLIFACIIPFYGKEINEMWENHPFKFSLIALPFIGWICYVAYKLQQK